MLFISLQRRSLRSSRAGSQTSVSSRNSQFSLQNVTWEASKTNLFGITELWLTMLGSRQIISFKCLFKPCITHGTSVQRNYPSSFYYIDFNALSISLPNLYPLERDEPKCVWTLKHLSGRIQQQAAQTIVFFSPRFLNTQGSFWADRASLTMMISGEKFDCGGRSKL